MAFDLASIEPSEYIAFRDSWIVESGLESVGADRLFDDVGLVELVELDTTEIKEYAKELSLSVIERKRLLKGILKLQGQSSNPPSTLAASSEPSFSTASSAPTPSNKSKKKAGARKGKKGMRRKHSKSKSKSPSRSSLVEIISNSITDEEAQDIAPMYDPTKKTSPISSPGADSVSSKASSSTSSFDSAALVSDAVQTIETDSSKTKAEIRQAFMEFRTQLNQREQRLLHDVDTTLDKKQRLLETQLEYIKENGGQGSKTELCCDPTMSLEIERKDILRTLIMAGWVKGASSANKEEQMQQELERKRRELARQQYLTVERLKQITLFERDCNSKRVDSMRLSHEVQEEIGMINVRTAKCETELAAAKPLLEAAQKLVSSISKTQLNEIRALKKPPAVVELVMSSVAVMLGNKIKSWRDIQKILANPKFVPSILEFDTMTLKKKTREECVKYTKHEDFNEERANKASKVAGPLVKWVKSQIKYSELLDVVRPMQKEIKVLKKKLNKKQKQLKMSNSVIETLETKISKARADINLMVENMIEMQDKYDIGSDQDDLAGKIGLMTDDTMKLYKKNVSL